MIASLQKFTTEFLPEEDRLRLSGVGEDGQQVVLWLTQRLLRRLVPHLCGWLEQQHVPGMTAALPQATEPAREQMQHMAQQVAEGVQQAQKQVPVQAQPGARHGLVQSASVEARAGRLQLILRVEQAPAVEYRVAFAPLTLRQWLGIVYHHCESAQWSLEIWPRWITPRGAAGHALPGMAVLH